ncbi:MAG TPA: polysaccharide biosynthesis/export family protein [Verrucomicrobiae bacterium]|nr:polysaccharide biosynthesis/export family protein [Verrucomicrobiae bacterium]
MKRLGSFVLLTLAGVLMSGCYITKRGEKFDARASRTSKNASVLTNLATIENTNRVRADWLMASTNFFRLGPGDKVEIEIMGDNSVTNSRALTQVGPDGKIYYYLLPGIDVWGMTLRDAEETLKNELKQYLPAPQMFVSMQLRAIDSTRVWVLGRVANAGIYPMATPMTVLEAVALAGGTMTSSSSGTTEDLADLSNSFVVRNGERLPVNFARLLQEGDMSQNIYLEPDDFIYFPSSASRDIYVLGAVRSPKAVPRQHNNLIGAIADAGGAVKNAYLSHVAVVRGSLDNPKIAIVDYNDIVRGKAPNVLLEPRDIVYVPFSPYRYLTKYLDLILTTFVRAVAINEGARAAEPGIAPAGISIGVTGTPGTVVVPGGTTTGAGPGTGTTGGPLR